MKLWLLESFPTHPAWDLPQVKVNGFVIRATDEAAARQIAHDNGLGETAYTGQAPWLDATASTCKEVLVDGEAGVILSDTWTP